MGRTTSPVFLRMALAVAVVLAVLAAMLRAGSWQPGPIGAPGDRGASGAATSLEQRRPADHWWDGLLGG